MTGVAADDGTWLSPGLNISSTVSVPALNIPPSNVSLAVAGANGAVQQSITMQVRQLPHVHVDAVCVCVLQH